jgi:Flp pilus assembly protein TadG
MGSVVVGEPADSKHDAPDTMMTFRKFRRSEGGATAVEMAVVLMAVILLILGVIEFSIAYWSMHTLLVAVEEVGRWVMINNTSPSVTTDAQTRMQLYLPAASSICTTPSAGQYCVSATASNGTVTLTASYGYNVIGITGSPLILKSQNTVPLD